MPNKSKKKEEDSSKMSNAATTSNNNKNKQNNEEKRKERVKRLQALHRRQNEARKMNHKEVVEEDRLKKLPANWEKQKERLEYEEAREKRKADLEAEGKHSYERVRALEWTAEESDAWERKRARRENPDQGFADFEQSSARQNDRLAKNIEPDMENYEKQKQELGEDDFYANTKTLVYGSHKPTNEAVDKMCADLEKQVEKRQGYSRRRGEKAGADVDFINERNMRFNSKVERFYGRYTTEIKQNLERGTAI